MINAFEFTILSNIQNLWTQLVAQIGSPFDMVDDIFAALPEDGDTSYNRAAIKELFGSMSSGNKIDDVTFTFEYPAVKASLPTILVEVADEKEDEVVGGFISENFNSSSNKWEVQRGGVFSKRYVISAHSFNPDTTLYLYSFVKYGLLLMRSTLPSSAGVHISGRPMIQDTQRFAPDIAYVRPIDVVIEGLLDSTVERFDTLEAVHVDVQES